MFIISDLLSLVPSSDKGTAPPPAIGSPAPKDPKGRLNFPLDPPRPLFLLFPRHVGCPFAERDVHQLVALVLANPSRFSIPSTANSPPLTDNVGPTTPSTTPITFLIVTHSDLTSSREWFASVLHSAVNSFTSSNSNSSSPPPDPSLIAQHFSLFPDPSGTLSSAYGIGSLPSYSSLFSKTMWAEITKLKESEAKIVNRTTGGGSDRWKAQGAVVVGADGLVKWWWRGEKAEEEGDWEEAVGSLGV